MIGTSSIDLQQLNVVIFAVPEKGAAMCRQSQRCANWILVLLTVMMCGRFLPAQADYPFRDPKLSDDQRITDLLGRLYAR